jgi:hypothetical protein
VIYPTRQHNFDHGCTAYVAVTSLSDVPNAVNVKIACLYAAMEVGAAAPTNVQAGKESAQVAELALNRTVRLLQAALLDV